MKLLKRISLFTIYDVVIIYAIIGVLWILCEKIFYGTVTPRLLDDFIAIAFAISIYMNLKRKPSDLLIKRK